MELKQATAKNPAMVMSMGKDADIGPVSPAMIAKGSNQEVCRGSRVVSCHGGGMIRVW